MELVILLWLVLCVIVMLVAYNYYGYSFGGAFKVLAMCMVISPLIGIIVIMVEEQRKRTAAAQQTDSTQSPPS